MTTTPTLPDSTLALNLAAEINALFHDARTTADIAKTNAGQAITRALECGRLLNRQKESLPRGDWLAWLATHCPDISHPTARRYMILAHRSRENDLSDAVSLRQAYVASGILPESLRTRREPDAKTPTVTFVRSLDQFRRWFNTRIKQEPLDRWTPEARHLLRNELTWFRQLHDQLASDATGPLAQLH